MIIYSVLVISTANYFMKAGKLKRKRAIVVAFSLFILVLFLSQRFKNDIIYLYENSIKSNSRYILCYCSLQTFVESNFTGIENGLVQFKLNECYNQYGFEELSKDNLNSHNQYLDFLLKGGFFLFIAFLSTQIIKLQNAYKAKNYLYFSITLLFAFSFLTENILIRQYGIYIYLFCDILFLGSVLINESHSTYKIKES
jgi:O-antigen ligase